MLPGFDAKGQLPPGIHLAGWSEFESAFGYNKTRRDPVKGMRMVLLNLRRAGCLTAYIDGSLVAQKLEPGYYDGCWDMANVGRLLVDPVLLDISGTRYPQKRKHMGETLPVTLGENDSKLGCFQLDRKGGARGIAMTRLGDLDD